MRHPIAALTDCQMLRKLSVYTSNSLMEPVTDIFSFLPIMSQTFPSLVCMCTKLPPNQTKLISIYNLRCVSAKLPRRFSHCNVRKCQGVCPGQVYHPWVKHDEAECVVESTDLQHRAF
ncbi:hypothetical protein ILYODFUR_034423 [Ilyodon furcidens]|uniref:Uncharacterized protein n=1 Tax=Ilyodon furcidens TaxID=33524 RepID=A0ABV0TG03_9TELE